MCVCAREINKGMKQEAVEMRRGCGAWRAAGGRNIAQAALITRQPGDDKKPITLSMRRSDRGGTGGVIAQTAYSCTAQQGGKKTGGKTPAEVG